MQIESGIPIPTTKHRDKYVYRKYPWAELEIGQSFFVPNRNSKHMSAVALAYSKRNRANFTSANEVKDGVHGCRVWRIA